MAERFHGSRERGRNRGQTHGLHRNPPSGKPDGSWRKKLGWNRLQELKEKPSSELLMTLVSSTHNLKDALDDDDLHDGMKILMLRCLAKSLDSSLQRHLCIELLIIIEQSKFFKITLPALLMNFPYGNQPGIRQALLDCMCIYREMSQRTPRFVVSLMGMLSILETVITKLHASTDIIGDEVTDAFQECYDIKLKVLQENKKRNEKQTFKNFDEETPPDDFRDYPVFPEASDIQPEAEEKLFLRRNRVKGGYIDVDDYLDVQFRLLREDFIYPLRKGVAEFLGILNDSGKNKRLQDLRIYHDIQILTPICSRKGLSHRISFSTEKLQHVRWESSKRLIFGSLVCLSNDNFKTLRFATVTDREPKYLKNGIIDLKFEKDQIEVSAISRDTRFIMAETTAYFESYKHVLTGLQQMREQQFPFQQYIVHCEDEVNPPAYLNVDEETKFDLRPLIDDEIILQSENRDKRLSLMDGKDPVYKFTFQSKGAEAVPITRFDKWPSPGVLQLDPSQYQAIQMALTKEFVITQGPPGTGKTYVGLKIAKALLHNYNVWNRDLNTGQKIHRPLLVVCYTNHALDQFLEGIVRFYKGDVLRIGGRSSSEIMEKKNIRNYRKSIRANKAVPDAIHRSGIEVNREMRNLEETVNKVAKNIETAEKEILHEDNLQNYMRQFYTQIVSGVRNFLEENDPGFNQRQVRKHSCIVEWLGYGNLINVEHGTVDTEDMDDEEHEDGPQPEMNVPENEEETIDVTDELDHIQALRMLEDEFDEILTMDKPQSLFQRIIGLNVSKIDEVEDSGNEWHISKKDRKKLKRKLQNELRSTDRMTEEETHKIYDVWDLTLKDKWRLYRYWIAQFCEDKKQQIRGFEEEFERCAARYNEILLQEDKEIIQRATVVGMTTTGAARYQSVLQEIQPRIVIVEEAAEVLEAHIITTLSGGCQHLILIGDHKQLKPNPTVYQLAIKYNLELSLFERMIKNDMEYKCLQLQHRMRPLISGMMKVIYPELKDHRVVKGYEDVKGISSNMYFIHHTYPETKDEDQRSHSNYYEAIYIVALCNYLLLQGYKPNQITVLTLYSGQLYELKKLMPKEKFAGVRVTVVDNFQGEENDIILMSLVRSNDERKIGFLKIENRVCVALSRAKIGLYVIGNLDLMKSESELWRNVVNYANKMHCFGEDLQLYCQNHPDDKGIVVTLPSDFDKAPEGGCIKPCEFRLKCGHTCKRACHISDQDHKDYQCRAPCQRKICSVDGHRCQRQCFRTCDLCQVLVEKVIPRCGHSKNVPCSVQPNEILCNKNCQAKLPCGHTCKNLCGERHTDKCEELFRKTFSCGHVGQTPCYKKSTAVCPKACQNMLECEHMCKGTCGACCNGKFHIPCKQKCGRTLVCGHECQDNCSLCSPCKRKCQNRCNHSRCQKLCGERCTPCTEECEWQCNHYRCNRICSEPCDRPRCNKPCRKRLPCNHSCIGLCGEPCPKLCRVCNAEKVTEIFFGDEDEPNARFVELEDCGHVIEYKAMDRFIDDGNTDGNKESVKLRECPKCKTEIRRNLRYGNIIKKTLLDIEKVKTTIRGDNKSIEHHKRSIETKLRTATLSFDTDDLSKIRLQYLDVRDREEIVWENAYVAIENKIEFIQKIKSVKAQWKDYIRHDHLTRTYEENLRDLDLLKDWILKPRHYFTDQEMFDIKCEFKRIVLLRSFLCSKQKILDCNPELERWLRAEILVVENSLMSKQKLSEQMIKRIEETLATLKTKLPGLKISETERLEILKAMNLQKGHWYKCPNGHVYAIGDCGGANQESICPDCKCKIGGMRHALASGNAVATEMDGARYSAWSEQANLENYQEFHL